MLHKTHEQNALSLSEHRMMQNLSNICHSKVTVILEIAISPSMKELAMMKAKTDLDYETPIPVASAPKNLTTEIFLQVPKYLLPLDFLVSK